MNVILEKLSTEVREALSLLKMESNSDTEHGLTVAFRTSEQDTLIQQCLELLQAQSDAETEPLRTIHHLACTGGTVFSECLATMPNVRFMFNVNPFGKQNFQESPTADDFASLLRPSFGGPDQALLEKMFLAQIEVLHKNYANCGAHLILQEHESWSVCEDVNSNDCRGLRDILEPDFALISIITVRHPADSFSDEIKNCGKPFDSSALERYCGRYLKFLDRHAGTPVFRYEDLLKNPEQTMRKVCETMTLSFNSQFKELLPHLNLGNDSNQMSESVKFQPKAIEVRSLIAAATPLPAYGRLCERLFYSE